MGYITSFAFNSIQLQFLCDAYISCKPIANLAAATGPTTMISGNKTLVRVVGTFC